MPLATGGPRLHFTRHLVCHPAYSTKTWLELVLRIGASKPPTKWAPARDPNTRRPSADLHTDAPPSPAPSQRTADRQSTSTMSSLYTASTSPPRATSDLSPACATPGEVHYALCILSPLAPSRDDHHSTTMANSDEPPMALPPLTTAPIAPSRQIAPSHPSHIEQIRLDGPLSPVHRGLTDEQPHRSSQICGLDSRHFQFNSIQLNPG